MLLILFLPCSLIPLNKIRKKKNKERVDQLRVDNPERALLYDLVRSCHGNVGPTATWLQAQRVGAISRTTGNVRGGPLGSQPDVVRHCQVSPGLPPT